MSDLLAALGPEWGASAWEPLYGGVIDPSCRDCGRTSFSWSHCCGGAGPAGISVLCDDCAALDGRGDRYDGHRNASHGDVDQLTTWAILSSLGDEYPTGPGSSTPALTY